MNCSSFDRIAERYFEGTLRTDERADLTAHCDGCASCAALFEELRVVDALLLEPRRVEPVANFTFAVMAELRALPAPAKRNVRFVSWLTGYLAVSWLIVAAAVAFAGPGMHAVFGSIIAIGTRTGLGLASVAQGTFPGSGTAGGALDVVLFAGSALVLDAVFAAAIIAVVLVVHPRLAARLAASEESPAT